MSLLGEGISLEREPIWREFTPLWLGIWTQTDVILMELIGVQLSQVQWSGRWHGARGRRNKAELTQRGAEPALGGLCRVEATECALSDIKTFKAGRAGGGILISKQVAKNKFAGYCQSGSSDGWTDEREYRRGEGLVAHLRQIHH